MENREFVVATEPVYVVKIKDVTGAIQKFTVKIRPRWDGDLIYVTESERGLILFNSQNIVSYSEKVVYPKKRTPKPERATTEENESHPVAEEPANEEG